MLIFDVKSDNVDFVVTDNEKILARQKLGNMLKKIDEEIAADAPMRDFDEVFFAIQKRIDDA